MRSTMCAASQLPGKGPNDVDDTPAPDLNQKSYYDDDMKIVLVFANSVDPVEMPLLLGLHYLSKYLFRGFQYTKGLVKLNFAYIGFRL